MSKYTYQEINGRRQGVIQTARGSIHTPTFFPVTTFGEKYPLDQLVQPYLKRLSQCIMVSYHYAQKMKERPDMPMFIDSGGFASLFERVQIAEHKDCASIKTKDGEEIHPLQVIEFQEEHADLAATLDFIITPRMDKAEARRRQKLTIKNAFYALKQKRSKSLFLYASLQCWDEKSARECAREYARAGFDGIAIGGLVPRARDGEFIKQIVSTVREEVSDLAVHTFGLGNPNVLKTLWNLKTDSSDSSSYIRKSIGTTHLEKPLPFWNRQLNSPHADLISVISNLWHLNYMY